MTRKLSGIAIAAFAIMALATSTAFAADVDAHGRALGSNRSRDVTPVYRDGFERALHAAGVQLSAAALVGDSHNRSDPGGSAVQVGTVASDPALEWSQIGIGVGVGLLIAVGLWAGIRPRKVGPLAP